MWREGGDGLLLMHSRWNHLEWVCPHPLTPEPSKHTHPQPALLKSSAGLRLTPIYSKHRPFLSEHRSGFSSHVSQAMLSRPEEEKHESIVQIRKLRIREVICCKLHTARGQSRHWAPC